jgi:hypothetical protein
MHFTIERKRLIKMLQVLHKNRPGTRKNAKELRLYACAARVFVEANDVTAGEETLVYEDGGCVVPLLMFTELLKSYSKKENVTVKADEKAMRIFTSTVPITGFTKDVSPPSRFMVWQVTDTWVVGGTQ